MAGALQQLPLLAEDNVFTSRLLVRVVDEEDFHLSGEGSPSSQPVVTILGNTTAVPYVFRGCPSGDTNLGSQNIDM